MARQFLDETQAQYTGDLNPAIARLCEWWFESGQQEESEDRFAEILYAAGGLSSTPEIKGIAAKAARHGEEAGRLSLGEMFRRREEHPTFFRKLAEDTVRGLTMIVIEEYRGDPPGTLERAR
jgi:hypothetical protein